MVRAGPGALGVENKSPSSGVAVSVGAGGRREAQETEQKVFSAQALVTQAVGSQRKKEREFDRLKAQLGKTVSAGNKGVRSCMTLSVPLPKNSSQTNAPSATVDTEAPGGGNGGGSVAGARLRDAELLSSQRSSAAILVENEKLREGVQGAPSFLSHRSLLSSLS